MSKRLVVVASVVMMIAWVDGCGEKQNATPTEQMIKEDITNNYKDYLDLNAYLYADIYGYLEMQGRNGMSILHL